MEGGFASPAGCRCRNGKRLPPAAIGTGNSDCTDKAAAPCSLPQFAAVTCTGGMRAAAEEETEVAGTFCRGGAWGALRRCRECRALRWHMAERGVQCLAAGACGSVACLGRRGAARSNLVEACTDAPVRPAHAHVRWTNVTVASVVLDNCDCRRIVLASHVACGGVCGDRSLLSGIICPPRRSRGRCAAFLRGWQTGKRFFRSRNKGETRGDRDAQRALQGGMWKTSRERPLPPRRRRGRGRRRSRRGRRRRGRTESLWHTRTPHCATGCNTELWRLREGSGQRGQRGQRGEERGRTGGDGTARDERQFPASLLFLAGGAAWDAPLGAGCSQDYRAVVRGAQGIAAVGVAIEGWVGERCPRGETPRCGCKGCAARAARGGVLWVRESKTNSLLESPAGNVRGRGVPCVCALFLAVLNTPLRHLGKAGCRSR